MLSEKKLHELAYSSYNNRDYAKAADLFRFLAMQNAINFDYWFGLGSSLFMQQKREEAIAPFRLAYLLDEHNLSCIIFLTECFLYTDRLLEAKEFLTKASRLCQNTGNEVLNKHRLFLEEELAIRIQHAG